MRAGRVIGQAMLVATLLLVAVTARADGQEDVIAAEMVTQADKHAEKGEHAEAVFLLKQAYESSPKPETLRKLALAHENIGGKKGLQEAIAAYRLYLDGKPEAKDRANVEKKVTTLETKLAAIENKRQKAERREADQADREAAVGGFLSGPFPRVILGIGFGSLLVSVASGITALALNNAAEDEPVHEDAQKKLDLANNFVIVANVSMAAGIVLAAAGTTLVTLDLNLSPSAEGARLLVTPTGAALTASF
jgi:hypothetical protein